MARQQRSTPPPRRRRINPVPLVLAAVVALGIIGAMAAGLGRGGGDQAAATFNVDCQHWCGSGTATISFGGSSATVSGGGCWDSGADGLQANFGDWQGIQGVSDYLSLIIFLPGEPSPTPDEHGLAFVPASGSINGSPFVLGPDVVVTYGADGTGSFSGTDVNGGGVATGTFSCH